MNGELRKRHSGFGFFKILSNPFARMLGSSWKSVRWEGTVKYDGKDYGGKELVFCKNGYAADLQYAGRQETEFGWTFSFALTWGDTEDCL